MWVCDQKSNQNGTSTFLLQLEVIAPKRAPSRMCFFDLYFEVPWRPKDLSFQKETRRARPQANDRGRGTSRKSLFQESDRIKSASGIQKWTDEETTALVQYICFYLEDAWTDKWPTGKDPEFWNACSESVNKACKSSRTGLSTMIDYNCLLSLYSLKERDISQ